MEQTIVPWQNNAAITHELDAFIDDKCLLLSNSSWHIVSGLPLDEARQQRLSARKKEIRGSLKTLWLEANPTARTADFNRWLNQSMIANPKLQAHYNTTGTLPI